MTDEAETYKLNDIGEHEFQRWKHHPVTRVFMRYLLDMADQLRRSQLIDIENNAEPMSPKAQGEYKGRVSTLTELSSIQFEHLVEFYPQPEEEDDDAA